MAEVEITLTMSAREFQFLRSHLEQSVERLRGQLVKLTQKQAELFDSDIGDAEVEDHYRVTMHVLRAQLAQLQELLEKLG
jgi:hypothetical protein